MTNCEKETYINMNDAEKEARLCTFNSTWMRKMDKLALQNPLIHVVRHTDEYAEYTFPKKMVKVYNPRKKKGLEGNFDMSESEDSNDE